MNALNISILKRLTTSVPGGGHSNPTKKAKIAHNVPLVFGYLNTKDTAERIRILLDSGASGSILSKKLTHKLQIIPGKGTSWMTMAGPITTTDTVKTTFILPEFHPHRSIEWTFNVTPMTMNYDAILGRDVLEELGMQIDFSNCTIVWDEVTVPMKNIDTPFNDQYYGTDTGIVADEIERIKRILDAKYEPAKPADIVAKCDHLSEDQKADLLVLLEEFEDLFDGTLGKWTGKEYDIELKPDAKPYHARAFPIPKAHEATLKMEIDRLCKEGVLRKKNDSEWAAPTFIIPKKDGTVRFISDFRELNKRIKRKPFPIPKISDLMMKLEGFQYATSLDLNMGYYHIELTPNAKKLCTIVLPWGKYEYQRLPMGLCNSPDIFQEKMSTLMYDLEYVRTYLDDILNITKGDWKDHLDKLREVFVRLRQAGLKINANKSFFGRDSLEYLGYWITRDGIQPVPKKVQAILNIAEPKTKKELRRFIGMINFYRDMWKRRSETLAPLTALTSSTVKFQWTDTERKAFNDIKKVISRETLLSYPDFTQPFIIHTDASNHQLGSVISQNNKPIAFYSRKLNPAQTRYTTTERELLAIVETLKEFRNILLGQKITVYTDHKNLTHSNFNTDRVMRWRLILEEYGPELIYTKGSTNIVADALSRLDIDERNEPADTEAQAECFALSAKDLDLTPFPIRLAQIQSAQLHDTAIQALRTNNAYAVKVFCGGDTISAPLELLTKEDKIVVPKELQQRMVQWYHLILCHPGENRTEQTIRQNFTWNNLRDTVHEVCSKCDTCQRLKRSTHKYGHLPEKQADITPWQKLCVDLIGPYTLTPKKAKKPLTLWCITMIDPATQWFEMAEIHDKEPATIANTVETTWLTRYPWPQEVIYDQGTEFLGEFARMLEEDYPIRARPTTTRNPQANAVLERAHQTLANIICTFKVQDNYLDQDDPWKGILAAAMFALRATYHTTLQATPMQVVT